LEKAANVNPKTYRVSRNDQPAHVMIVDDEPEVLAAISKILEAVNFRVTKCASAAAALAALESPDAVDCLVTDQTMPDMSGLELCQTIQRQELDVPMILISGYSVDLIGAGQNAHGIKAFLQKPLASGELIEHIRQVIATR
jgi:FixJ family two-component response regulator